MIGNFDVLPQRVVAMKTTCMSPYLAPACNRWIENYHISFYWCTYLMFETKLRQGSDDSTEIN